MSRVQVTEPGWVVAECACGFTREISTDEAVALQRIDLVKRATLPAGPPLGLPVRPVEASDTARLRALALDMWRRGAIDDEAYQRAVSRIEV